MRLGSAATAPVLLCGVSARRLGGFIALELWCCLLSTCALCVLCQSCGAYTTMPSMDQMFVPFPSSVISRMALVAVAAALGAFVLIIYLAQPRAQFARAQLALGLTGTFALSTAAAVCVDEAAPSCEGNALVHSGAAAVAFGCFDLYALASMGPCAHGESHDDLPLPKAAKATTAAARLVSSPAGCRPTLCTILLVVSLMCKVRWLPFSYSDSLAQMPPPAPQWLPETLFAAAAAAADSAATEWLDALALSCWMFERARGLGDKFWVGWIRNADGPAGAGAVLTSCGLQALGGLMLGLASATILSTFAISWARGDINPLEDWPMISDMWTRPPTNYISRQWVVLDAYLLCVAQLGHYLLTKPHRAGAPALNKLCHAASLVALLGLALVGACNECEVEWLHYVGAGLFFGCFGLYMTIDCAWSFRHWRPARRLATLTCCVVFVLGHFGPPLLLGGSHHHEVCNDPVPASRGFAEEHLGRYGGSGGMPWPIPQLEWCATVAFMAYIPLSYGGFPDGRRLALALVATTPA